MMDRSGERGLAEAWLAAAADPTVALELEAIYTFAAAEIESRGPACWASGRCCNFEAAGHRLYVTGLEAAYTALRVGPGVLTAESLKAAMARGGCPFQATNLCGAHEIRPLGCRVYFCDRSAQEWQQDLCERALLRLRGLHERRRIEYRYGEWRGMLGMFVSPAPP